MAVSLDKHGASALRWNDACAFEAIEDISEARSISEPNACLQQASHKHLVWCDFRMLDEMDDLINVA
jgi:hypothetical protein